MKPIIRWAGSKRKQVALLSAYYERLGRPRYIEPFCGSACFLLASQPPEFIASDVNAWLIETYQAIATSPHEVHERMASLPADEETYYKIRAMDRSHLGPIERAANFLFLNRYCFNGIFRTNKSGHFNVPFSGKRNGPPVTVESLILFAQYSLLGKLLIGDFESVVRKNAKRGDFVYLDPPYAIPNQRIFRQYDAATFGYDDFQRLSKLLDWLDRTGAYFLLSYAASDEIKSLTERWTVRNIVVQRNVSATATNRRPAGEFLISNF